MLSHVKSFVTLLGHGVPNIFFIRNGDWLPQNIIAEHNKIVSKTGAQRSSLHTEARHGGSSEGSTGSICLGLQHEHPTGSCH